MLNIVLAEDNQYDLSILKKLLSKIPELNIVGETANGDELIEISKQQTSDVFFVDINMPGKSGLEAAKEILSSKPEAFVVFATAYSEYAKDAYDINAVDFITKPYDFERIIKTIEKINKIIKDREIIKSLEHTSKAPISDLSNDYNKKLMISFDDNLYLLNIYEIIMITRSNRKTHIYTEKEVFKTNDTLESLQNKLPSTFIRSHKGYIVNTDKIIQIIPWGNKTYMIKFSGLTETALITIERVKSLKQKYKM